MGWLILNESGCLPEPLLFCLSTKMSPMNSDPSESCKLTWALAVAVWSVFFLLLKAEALYYSEIGKSKEAQ